MDATGQMTIFDYISELDDIPVEEMVRQVSEAVGIVFERKTAEWFENGTGVWYESRKSKHEMFDLCYDRYADTNRKFIGAGWQYKTSAGGVPCDTIQEAIDFFNRAKVTIQKEKVRIEQMRKEEHEYNQMKGGRT